MRAAKIKLVIPPPKHRREPAFYSTEPYKLRHKVENHFRKLFDFRRIATRFDKLARTYLAFDHLVSAVVLLRGIR